MIPESLARITDLHETRRDTHRTQLEETQNLRSAIAPGQCAAGGTNEQDEATSGTSCVCLPTADAEPRVGSSCRKKLNRLTERASEGPMLASAGYRDSRSAETRAG